ncbi:hypothetical protein LC612_37400 [Nostoc sp. CHAB 5834]|nr:hypothetical protein [Nostoc sp. CHAB 5834]
MSKYGWERGTFKFSTTGFRDFKKNVVDAYNKQRAADFETLCKLHSALKALGKGKRNFNWNEGLQKLLDETLPNYSYGFRSSVPVYNFKTIEAYSLDHYLLTKLDKEKGPFHRVPSPPVTPKKGDFKLVSVTKPEVLQVDVASVSFDVKTREVTWNVSENNHAVECARESFLGELFFKELRKVVWTRGTGGVISGNDEYARDSREAGDAGNYTVESFGPIGAKHDEDRLRIYIPRRRSKGPKPVSTRR